MAFCTAFHTILDRNIRHVYSDSRPHVPFRKISTVQPTNDPAKRLFEEQFKPRDKYLLKSMVYVPEYDIQLPKAPAFRQMNSAEIRRLVARLSRPIQCQMTSYTCHKEQTRQIKEMCGNCELNTMPNSVSKKQLDRINQRVQRPTTSSSNRIRMRTLQKFDIYEINDSCRKAGSRPNSLLPRY